MISIYRQAVLLQPSGTFFKIALRQFAIISCRYEADFQNYPTYGNSDRAVHDGWLCVGRPARHVDGARASGGV